MIFNIINRLTSKFSKTLEYQHEKRGTLFVIQMRVFYQKITSDIFSISSLARISSMSFTAFCIELYLLVVKTIFYSFTPLIREILFSPLEDNEDLLTECVVCTGKYLPEVSLRKIFFRTDRANEVNKEFIIQLLVYFLLKFAMFLSSEFAVTLSCQLFCVASRLHQFGFHLLCF